MSKNLCVLGLALIIFGLMFSFIGKQQLQRKQKQYNQDIFQSLNHEVSGDTGSLRVASRRVATLRRIMVGGGVFFVVVGGALWVGGLTRRHDLA